MNVPGLLWLRHKLCCTGSGLGCDGQRRVEQAFAQLLPGVQHPLLQRALRDKYTSSLRGWGQWLQKFYAGRIIIKLSLQQMSFSFSLLIIVFFVVIAGHYQHYTIYSFIFGSHPSPSQESYVFMFGSADKTKHAGRMDREALVRS